MKKLLLVVVLLGLVAVGGLYAWAELELRRPVSEGPAPDVELSVAKGSSAKALGPLLANAGLIRDAKLWRYYLWRHSGLKVKAGRFKVNPHLTIPELAAVLEGPPLPEDEPFVMIEGWRLRDTDAALAAKGWIKAGEYIEKASHPESFHAPFPLPHKTLEGYLYPETFHVTTAPLDVAGLIQRQLDMFAERFFTPHQPKIAKSGRTLHQLVTLASLLEREEPVPAQRPLVAGILWKRFDKQFPLGVDATSRYELPEWNDRIAFLAKLRDPDDAWNTRTKKGLPPGPIGAPTVESLVAALQPVKSDFWYYLHDGQKKLHPSRNAAEHEKLRAKYSVY
jgi:UPF0755 protein